MFWWLMKYVILGPPLRLLFRPKVVGLENVPAEGPVIMAANHESFLDDFLLPLVLKRRATILAKADYFDRWYTAWFFKMAGCVPVRRQGGSASRAALESAIGALGNGRLVALFPEGTRSPDGRLYRGKTGVARMALEAHAPVVPAAVMGTFELLPYDRRFPRPGRVEIRFGKPITFERQYATPADRFVLRSVTDEIMYEIMMLSGQEYVDEYGSKMKDKIETAKKDGSASAPTLMPDGESAAETVGEPAVRSGDS